MINNIKFDPTSVSLGGTNCTNLIIPGTHIPPSLADMPFTPEKGAFHPPSNPMSMWPHGPR